jgi:hypothetical protein
MIVSLYISFWQQKSMIYLMIVSLYISFSLFLREHTFLAAIFGRVFWMPMESPRNCCGEERAEASGNGCREPLQVLSLGYEVGSSDSGTDFGKKGY